MVPLHIEMFNFIISALPYDNTIRKQWWPKNIRQNTLTQNR